MPRKPRKLDSIVMVTVLTTNPKRRDQIDQALDKAFSSDERVQVIRVVGYPNTDDITKLSRDITTVVS